MASNIKVDIVRPTATNGSLSLKGDSGGSATTNGVTVNSSGNTAITGTTTVSSLVATTADINGGTIDGTDITVGSGKTLDVSAGTLTLANDQISGDKVEGGTIAATTITTLTSTTINAGDGAAGTPSITNTGDTNTGIYFPAADTVGVSTGGTERMRIDSSGNVSINTNNVLSSSLMSVDGSGVVANGIASKVNVIGYFAFVGVNPSGTNSFLVYGDGDVENTNNSYGSISDERLKSNIADASSQIDDIMAVQVRSYTLNETGDKHIGVIAQELESSGMSGLVKTNEEGIKSVKYSVLYMKAIKALQEAVSKIELLESRIETLENA